MPPSQQETSCASTATTFLTVTLWTLWVWVPLCVLVGWLCFVFCSFAIYVKDSFGVSVQFKSCSHQQSPLVGLFLVRTKIQCIFIGSVQLLLTLHVVGVLGFDNKSKCVQRSFGIWTEQTGGGATRRVRHDTLHTITSKKFGLSQATLKKWRSTLVSLTVRQRNYWTFYDANQNVVL